MDFIGGWGGVVLNCLFSDFCTPISSCSVCAPDLWHSSYSGFSFTASRIQTTAHSCPLRVNPASFFEFLFSFSRVYIIMKLPNRQYARGNLSDPMNFWKCLILPYHSDSQKGKWNHYKHLNWWKLMEKISYRRTEKPNKKGNPDIIDSAHSKIEAGRTKRELMLADPSPGPDHLRETEATGNTHNKGQILLEG